MNTTRDDFPTLKKLCIKTLKNQTDLCKHYRKFIHGNNCAGVAVTDTRYGINCKGCNNTEYSPGKNVCADHISNLSKCWQPGCDQLSRNIAAMFCSLHGCANGPVNGCINRNNRRFSHIHSPSTNLCDECFRESMIPGVKILGTFEDVWEIVAGDRHISHYNALGIRSTRDIVNILNEHAILVQRRAQISKFYKDINSVCTGLLLAALKPPPEKQTIFDLIDHTNDKLNIIPVMVHDCKILLAELTAQWNDFPHKDAENSLSKLEQYVLQHDKKSSVNRYVRKLTSLVKWLKFYGL